MIRSADPKFVMVRVREDQLLKFTDPKSKDAGENGDLGRRQRIGLQKGTFFSCGNETAFSVGDGQQVETSSRIPWGPNRSGAGSEEGAVIRDGCKGAAPIGHSEETLVRSWDTLRPDDAVRRGKNRFAHGHKGFSP